MSQWQQGQPYGQPAPIPYGAGWYPDPGGAGERWWDGTQWTVGVRPAGYGGASVPGVGTNGFAIASLLLSLTWVFWLGSILAVVFGHVALSQTRHRHEGGRGLAIAGLVLGYLGVALLVTFIIVGLVAGSHSSGQVHYGNPEPASLGVAR